MRIDNALVPPGFIASAKMYSLIIKNGILYIIHTGPAPTSQKDYTKVLLGYRAHKGILENIAVSAMIKSMIKKVKEGEKRIGDNLEELASEKNSSAVTISEIQNLKIKETPADVELRFTVGKKKYRFDLPLVDKDEVIVFGKALQ